MKYNFCIVSPQQIANNPKAIEYLERGAAEFGGIFTVAKMLHNYQIGIDILVEIKNDIKLVGAIHLTLTQQESGKILTSVLLGGDHFDEWSNELSKFYYKLLAEHDCDEFMLMGRRGFKRYFPELNEVATVFRLILKPKGKNIK